MSDRLETVTWLSQLQRWLLIPASLGFNSPCRHVFSFFNKNALLTQTARNLIGFRAVRPHWTARTLSKLLGLSSDSDRTLIGLRNENGWHISQISVLSESNQNPIRLIGAALSWHFAILVNKICKILSSQITSGTSGSSANTKKSEQWFLRYLTFYF